jgi:hypothetical protein
MKHETQAFTNNKTSNLQVWNNNNNKLKFPS